ncbi:DUF484 family protein [uncultured Endozoicomonas sp.]|uniref:DUF484 family protein n=1 Tax=uncultured Endozoicomonas sp. TaxID=432652 RepID=UPI002637BC56|nr:DUF484 family protein [uncultured Endozoicomonas sp.]
MTEEIVEARETQALTARQVADYLQAHPDFFVDRDDLLLELTLPHKRGDTISLVERQVALLRERALDYRYQLNRLSENAKENEQLFEKMRLLVLSLLESKDLEQLIDTISDSLNHEFGIEFHSLMLFSDKPMSLPVRIEHNDVANMALGSLLSSGKAVSGQVTPAEMDFLFQEQSEKVGSVAIIPLNYSLIDPPQLGILALGSSDKEHFKAGMGTVFISYLGDVLSRVLARHMRS